MEEETDHEFQSSFRADRIPKALNISFSRHGMLGRIKISFKVVRASLDASGHGGVPRFVRERRLNGQLKHVVSWVRMNMAI